MVESEQTLNIRIAFLTIGLVLCSPLLSQKGKPPAFPEKISVNNEGEYKQMISFFEKAQTYQKKTDEEIFTEKHYAYATNGIHWAKKSGTDIQKGWAQYYSLKVLWANSDWGDKDKIIEVCNEFILNKAFQEKKEVTEVLSNLKYAYLSTKRYEELVDMYPIYGRLNKKHGRNISKSDFVNDKYIADAYYKQKNYKAAANYYKSQGNKPLKNPNLEASRLNNIALCYAKMNEWDSALIYFDKGIIYIERHKAEATQQPKYGDYLVKIIKSNKADYLLLNGKPAEALPFYKSELEASYGFNESHITSSAGCNIARAYYALRKPKKALQYLDSAIAIMKKHELKDKLAEAYMLKGKCLSFMDETDEADVYFGWASRISDSLVAANSSQKYFSSTIKYEMARKESDLALSEEKIKNQKNKNIFQLIGLIVLAIGLIALYFLYKKIAKDKAIIAQKRKEAEIAVAEKDILLKEIHHRVKNNLQVISGMLDLQLGKIKSPEYELMVEDSQRYIHSMAMVHEMLYKNNHLSDISLQEYLNKLSSHISASQLNRDVEVNVDADAVQLSIEKAIPLGLIVSELMTNSYKHAFETGLGNIFIGVKKEGNSYTFRYKDNGKGLPDDFDINSRKTLGFRLLKMFAEEMDAELSAISEGGILVHFRFKD